MWAGWSKLADNAKLRIGQTLPLHLAEESIYVHSSTIYIHRTRPRSRLGKLQGEAVLTSHIRALCALQIQEFLCYWLVLHFRSFCFSILPTCPLQFSKSCTKGTYLLQYYTRLELAHHSPFLWSFQTSKIVTLGRRIVWSHRWRVTSKWYLWYKAEEDQN